MNFYPKKAFLDSLERLKSLNIYLANPILLIMINNGTRLINFMVFQALKYYGPYVASPNLHMLNHIPEDYERLGMLYF